jgi:precorrin-6Y C5,15-methyltransferase (decarboxylating)
MLTIIGNGMGDYNFNNLINMNIDFSKYDKIVCDKNFKEDMEKILKGGYKDAREYILENYNKENILYVVTGSPFFFSAGVLIANKLPKNKVKIINNISSKAYMQEKLFINDNDINTFSLHGKANIDLTKFLTNNYTFIVCDKITIDKVKEALKHIKPQDIEITIGYKLGYNDEVIEQINIFDFSYRSFDLSQPYVLIIKRLFTPLTMISEDIEFETQRGMITKKYKRHLTLQNLDLEPNQLLWDIGAGSGSCGIEAYKRYKAKTIFFEKQPQRIEYIKQNLINHKVCDTLLLEGDAQNLFEFCEQNPQRIFIGGGGEKVINKLIYLYERLDTNGIMLINAITLQNLSHMITVLDNANINYETHSISLTTYKGKLNLVEPERQLFQIKIYKIT